MIRAKGRKEGRKGKRSEGRMENYENAGDKNGGGDESGGFDQRSYEQSGIADARVSRKTSLNPVRVVSHPTLETSSNETTEVGGNGGLEKSGTVEFTRKIV